MLPLESTPVVTTFIPAMTADAGLVPWADVGMMPIFLLPSPLDLWKPLMAISPAYSPAAPELGCRETESKPVMTASCCARSYTSNTYTSKKLFQTVTEEKKCITTEEVECNTFELATGTYSTEGSAVQCRRR